MKIFVTIIPKDLVTNSFLSSFLLFYKPKTRIRFSARWWSGNEKYFCFLLIASHLKAMPNAIDVYKRIFLHVIPVCVIVSCWQELCFIVSLKKHDWMIHEYLFT